MRGLIKQADPDVVEEWKWMGTPVWSHDGIICTGEILQEGVKLTFAKGAALKDPAALFQRQSRGRPCAARSTSRRARKSTRSAFKALVREAIALNSAGKVTPKKAKF